MITRLLIPHGRRQRGSKGIEGNSADEPVARRSKPTAKKVLCNNIATLTPGAWINDKVTHFVGRVLIAPQQTPNQPKVHIYPYFYMGRLHNEEAGAGGYNSKAVRNDDNRIDGGLAALDKLYIPFNADTPHCDFIQVAVHASAIQLFDSQGKMTTGAALMKNSNFIFCSLSLFKVCIPIQSSN